MIFLGLLIALVIYLIIAIGVAWFVYYLFETPRAKKIAAAIVIIIALLIPTADHFVGYLIFKSYCSRYSGLKIFITVEGVKGFYDESGTFKESIWYMGYDYVERIHRLTGTLVQYSFAKDGSLITTSIEEPTSQYVYSEQHDYLGWGVRVSIMKVKNFKNKSILAKQTTYSYGGGWVMRFLTSGSGSGFGTCGEQIQLNTFITKTLKPFNALRSKE